MKEIVETIPMSAEAMSWGMSIAQAIIFLVGGYLVARLLARFVRRQALKYKSIDDTLGSFVSSVVQYLVLLIVFIAVLQVFGFQATSLVAVLGAASLAIGLSLQGTLSHVAAGVMLVVVRPFKLGDFVEAGGASGTITDMKLFTTRLTTPQNLEVVVPNGQMWGSTIVNYSQHDTRRLDITFGIDYADDPDKAAQVITDMVEADGRGLADPAPWVRVVELNESSVDLQLRVWCKSSDYHEFKFALLKSVKAGFDDAGISIPYPHQVEIQRAS